ncbi:hypothetical protein [Roseovarius sp. Pro17]|uniref:hypothetical protein n=1 Tax=Roseovarius sp. Pro17 TaxID=3108175 RepID=UPI002D77A724|nr:hypothetical protein [Roseovarius sp. Pro17]
MSVESSEEERKLKRRLNSRTDACVKLADHAQRAAIHYSAIRLSFVVSNITVATLLVGLFFRFSETLNPWVVAGSILILGISFALINQKVGTAHLYYNNAAGFFYQQAVKDAGFEGEFKKNIQSLYNKGQSLRVG